MRMAGPDQPQIMGVAIERSVVHELEASGRLPALQMIRKFERAVLYQLRIETAVGGEIDIFDEDAVHGRLDFGAGPVDTEMHDV